MKRVAHVLACVPLFLLICIAHSQAFGRFGYDASNPVLGFEVDKEGFRIPHDRADKVRYEVPSQIWKPIQTSDTSQTIGLSGQGRSPLKLRSDLYGTGFELYFRHGFALKLGSLSSPFLTWSEGSVGQDVPTPAVSWVLVSFRDSQPPFLLGFLGPPCAVKLSGKSGQWRLSSADVRDGWVRVVAPLGATPFPTNSAGDLGSLLSRVKPDVDTYSSPTPKLLGVSVEDDLQGVVATWRFDRSSAVVPPPFVLAPIGGYPMKLLTNIRKLPGKNDVGPIWVSEGDTISARFPVRRVPTGRCVTLGDPIVKEIGTVSAFDIPSVVELAVQNLMGFRDKQSREAATEALQEFLSESAYVAEPFSDQRLPFAVDGKGIDLVAAHAILMQATISSNRSSSEPNSLLTSVIWRRDAYTWKVWTSDQNLARRAGALAAIAGALCPEPERRLEGAMFQAGLSAERGYSIWLKRLGIEPSQTQWLEPAESLRGSMFALEKRTAAGDALLAALQSEVRVYGDISVTAKKLEDRVEVSWLALDTTASMIVFASAYPVEVFGGRNLALQGAEEALGFTVVRYQPSDVGYCQLFLRPPTWAGQLPATPSIAAYDEAVRALPTPATFGRPIPESFAAGALRRPGCDSVSSAFRSSLKASHRP